MANSLKDNIDKLQIHIGLIDRFSENGFQYFSKKDDVRDYVLFCLCLKMRNAAIIYDKDTNSNILVRPISVRHMLEMLINLKLIKEFEEYSYILYFQFLDTFQKVHNRQERMIQHEYDYYERANDKGWIEESDINIGAVKNNLSYGLGLYEDEMKKMGTEMLLNLIDTQVLNENKEYGKYLNNNLQKYFTKITKERCFEREFGRVSSKKQLYKEINKILCDRKISTWSAKADYVGLSNHYEYVYSQTSSLLHGGAFSIFTNSVLNEGEIHIYNRLSNNYINDFLEVMNDMGQMFFSYIKLDEPA